MRRLVTICLVIGLAIVSFAFGVLIALLESKTCISHQCQAKSILIKHSLNTSTDPCENFYKYACGKYDKYNASRSGRISDIRTELEVAVLKEVANVLRADVVETDDPVVKIAKAFYRSCTDVEAIEYNGFASILNRVLVRAYGFPLLQDNWMEVYENSYSVGWSEMDLFKLGFERGALFELKLDNELRDAVVIASVAQAPPGPAPPFEHVLQFYLVLYRAMTGDDPPEYRVNQLKQVATLKLDILNVQKRISRQCPVGHRIYRPEHDERYILLGRESTEFEYLKKIFSHIRDDDIFNVSITFKEYIKEIDEIITKIPDYKRIFANFQVLELLTRLVNLLPKKVRDGYDKYLKGYYEGTDVIVNQRSLYCAQLMKNALPNHLTAHYLKTHKGQVSYDRDLRNVIDFLKNGMIRKLRKSTWISKSDKSKAISKVKNLKVVTPFSRNDIKMLTKPLNEHIKNDLARFCAGVCVVHELMNIRKLSRVIMKVFDRSYDVYSTEVTYDRVAGVIVLPVSYLSFPLIHRYWPKYLTFGVMGSRLARAMWKALDFDFHVDNPPPIMELERYDEYDYTDTPALKPYTWSNKTMNTYADKRNCTLSDYNDFLRPFIRRTLYSVMCVAQLPSHSLGVQAAYFGYREYHKTRFFNEANLPKLNQYSNDQNFFIDLSTYFCMRNRGPYSENMTAYEIGLYYNEFTLNEILRNNEMFIKVFDCKKSSYMSRANKCSVF